MLNQFLSVKEINDYLIELDKLKLWFEEYGLYSDLNTIEDKIKLINHNLFKDRKNKYDKYNSACEKFLKIFNSIYTKTLSLANERPWTQKYFEDKVDVKYSETLMWYDKIKVQQDTRKFYEV